MTRMSLDAITSGRVDHPIAMVLIGQPGAGKSTLGAGADGSVMLPVEDGCGQLDVKRFPVPESFADVREVFRELATAAHPFRTLVVDGIDTLESLIWKQVCESAGKDSIEAFGYGKGYVAALDQWRILLAACDDLRRRKAMHVMLIGHSVIRPFSDPSLSEPYDRFEMRLHRQAAGLLSQWADIIGFAVHDDVVQAGARKAVGTGNRILRVHHTPAMDAKNRYGITGDLPLSWAALMAAIESNSPDTAARVRTELEALIAQMPEAKRAAATKFCKAAGSDVAKLKLGLKAAANAVQPAASKEN